MAYTIDTLINALNQLYAKTDNAEDGEDGEDGYTYFTTSDETDEVEMICNSLLITSTGCNWANIRILREKGYDVWAGDSDSYGWLTGCIQKIGDRRILVYG